MDVSLNNGTSHKKIFFKKLVKIMNNQFSKCIKYSKETDERELLIMKGQMNVDYNKWFTKGMQVEFISYDEFGVLGQYVQVRNDKMQVMWIDKKAISWE